MPNLFDEDTNKQGLIVYGGMTSSNFGMVVAEAPAYERPKRKETIYNVPGRNGAIVFQQDAWEDVQRTYKVWLAEDSDNTLVEKVDTFETYLNAQNGWNWLTDNFEPDVMRKAYYSGGVGFSNNLTQYGEADLTFTCRPERFLVSGQQQIMNVTDGYVFDNPSPFSSKPWIHISNGFRGTYQISIAGVSMTVDVELSIEIDCETMNANRFGVNANDKISGSFPVIPYGQNAISITTISGYSPTVSVIPRYFII